MEKLKKSHKQKDLCVFVFRTNNKGDKLMNAKPCNNCYNCINLSLKNKNYKLKKIYYSDENGIVQKCD